MKIFYPILVVIIGFCLLASGITFHYALADLGDDPSDDPGERLELIQALKYEAPGGSIYGLGVYLGTYSLGVNHCAWMTAAADGSSGLVCGRINDDGSYQGETAHNGAGFGVMYMTYPTACGGGCYAVPRIRLLIPIVDSGEANWTSYVMADSAEFFKYDDPADMPPELGDWPELLNRSSFRQLYKLDEETNAALSFIGNDGKPFVEMMLKDPDVLYHPVITY